MQIWQHLQSMSWQAWYSILVVVGIFAVLQLRKGVSTDLVFSTGLLAVALPGIISPKKALEGFASSAVLVIGGLFVVAAALRHTGVLDWLGYHLLGRAKTDHQALKRLTFFEIIASAFVPNTPVVALLVPVVMDWCRQRGVSASRLLLPVSYLAVLGGVCTLIGTSTNLVVQDRLRSESGNSVAAEKEQKKGEQLPFHGDEQKASLFREQLHPMSMFEIGWVGLPCALAGGAYIMFLGYRLLPKHGDLMERLGEQRREYLVEMLVKPECRLAGQTVEEAGLRHLPGLFLIEIDRDNEVITPITPKDVIRANDRLVFTGIVSTIVDLEKIPGLVPIADSAFEVNPSTRARRHLTEVVLSSTSPLIDQTIREANFRQLYNAAVVAVHRNGERLTNKVGDIRLQSGDTLLLQTRTEFVENYRNSQDFYLVSRVEGSRARRHDRAWLAMSLFALLIVWLSCQGSYLGGLLGEAWNSEALAAMAIAGLMIGLRCLPMAEARSAIDLQVLITIGCALGLGQALDKSGAAHDLADLLTLIAGQNQPYLLLIVMYVMTLILTEFLSNSAVAAMMFPFAVHLAETGEVSPRPFIMAVTLAASLSFMSPVGYQTNLMVMGPGGYRPADYIRVGAPLTFIVTAIALILIPLVWPFAL